MYLFFSKRARFEHYKIATVMILYIFLRMIMRDNSFEFVRVSLPILDLIMMIILVASCNKFYLFFSVFLSIIPKILDNAVILNPRAFPDWCIPLAVHADSLLVLGVAFTLMVHEDRKVIKKLVFLIPSDVGIRTWILNSVLGVLLILEYLW